jgi:AcrR family transcriptional regulator
LSHGSIFLHFPTKEALLQCALERVFKVLSEKTHQLPETGGGIEALLKGFLGIVEKHEAFYKHLVMEIHTLPPEAKNLLIALRSVNARHFEIVVKQGIRQGRIKKLPLHLMFNTWMGLVYYYLQNSEWFVPGQPVIKRRKKEFVAFYMALITK